MVTKSTDPGLCYSQASCCAVFLIFFLVFFLFVFPLWLFDSLNRPVTDVFPSFFCNPNLVIRCIFLCYWTMCHYPSFLLLFCWEEFLILIFNFHLCKTVSMNMGTHSCKRSLDSGFESALSIWRKGFVGIVTDPCFLLTGDCSSSSWIYCKNFFRINYRRKKRADGL